MIKKQRKNVIRIAKSKQVQGAEGNTIKVEPRLIGAVYRGAVLVWQAIRSCFGSGFWINEKQWDNNEAWKNLK